jgi:cell wall-associated NlpC family hydrolase
MLLRTLWGLVVAVLVFSEIARAADAVDLAASLIGRPYAWGAEGPDAFDCSGLTQFVFREFDVDLPRRAISQSKVGDRINRRLQRGDLVFFANDARRSLVTHVGIYESDGTMIEASKRYGEVRRSNIDDEYWVERFMFARRILVDSDGPEIPRYPGKEREETSVRRPRHDVRRAAARVLAEVAGVLLRRPR